MNLVPLQPDFPKSFPESSKKILEEDLDESRPRRLSSLNDLTSAEAEAPCTPPNKPRKYSKKFKSLSKKTKSERKYEGSFDSIINEDFCAPLDLEFKLYPPGVSCLKFSDSNTQPSSEGASSLDSKSDLPGFDINSPLMPFSNGSKGSSLETLFEPSVETNDTKNKTNSGIKVVCRTKDALENYKNRSEEDIRRANLQKIIHMKKSRKTSLAYSESSNDNPPTVYSNTKNEAICQTISEESQTDQKPCPLRKASLTSWGSSSGTLQSDRQSENTAAIILDWDDTILPTSQLFATSAAQKPRKYWDKSFQQVCDSFDTSAVSSF